MISHYEAILTRRPDDDHLSDGCIVGVSDYLDSCVQEADGWCQRRDGRAFVVVQVNSDGTREYVSEREYR